MSDTVADDTLTPLGKGRKGMKGQVVRLGTPDAELERRLLEIGFVEGARVEILHEGLIGGDPLAVRLDDMRVALRRREAAAVIVRVAR